MTKRWAFFGLTVLSAVSVLRCGSSNVLPPLEVTGDDSGQPSGFDVYVPPNQTDSGNLTDSHVPPQQDTYVPPPVDTGTPGLSVSTTSVDFGLVPCGTQAQRKLVTLTNTGTAVLTVSGVFSANGGVAFTGDFETFGGQPDGGAQSIVLNPGQQASLSLDTKPIPIATTTLTTANFFTDTFSISTTPALTGANANPQVAVSATPQGAIVAFSTSAIDFGEVPEQQPSSVPFQVKNNGNAPVEVDLAIATGSTSTSTIVRSPLGPFTVSPASPESLTAKFSANDTNPQTGTMTVSLTSNPSNVICQPLPSAMTLSGTGTSGIAVVNPASIYFGPKSDGFVDCNTTASPQPITITNLGNAPINFTVGAPSTNYFTVSPTSGTVPAAVGTTPGTSFFNVNPAKIPATSAVTSDLYSGSVSVTTTAVGDTAHVIQLHMTAHGAILPATVANGALVFGNETVNTTATQQFSIANNGNADAIVSLSNGSSAFVFTPNTAFAVNAGKSVGITADFTPGNTGPFNDSAIVKVDPSTPMCSVVPSNIALSGTGVPVSAPVMSLSATSLGFGNVPCGTSASAPQTFSIDNKGTAPFTVTFSLRNGSSSLFTAAPISGTVGTGTGRAASVSMASPIPATASIAADFYADVLTVTATNAGGSVSQDLPIHITAQGAIMVLQPTKLDFGTVPIGATPQLGFTIENQGNLAAEVDMNVANGAGSSSKFSRAPLGPQTVAAAGNKAMTATFDAVDSIAQDGTIQLFDTKATGNVFCAPMPPVMTLVGTGTSVTSTVSPGAIDFGSTLCGQTAAQQSVTIANNASTGITWSATVTNGASFYNISPTGTQSLGGNAQATLTISPVKIPQTSSVSPNFFGGTVTISTNAPNDQPHVIQLTQTAQGVILTSTTTSIDFGAVAVNQSPAATQQFSVTNTGNLAVSGVTLQNGKTVFAVNPNDPSNSRTLDLPSLAPNAVTAPVISFTPSSATAFTDQVTFAIPGSVTLCAPAPANIALSGSGTTGIAVSPTSLDFGLVQCPAAIVTDAGFQLGPPQQASPQSVAITNQGSATTYSVQLVAGSNSPYGVTDSTNTSIVGKSNIPLPSGSTTINVVPKPILRPASTASDAFADTLIVTIGSTNYNVGLHQTAQGANLSYQPPAIASFDANPQHVTFQNFVLQNTGNYAVSYVISVQTTKSNIGGNNFTINLPAPNSLQQLFGGATQNGVLQTESNAEVGCPAACTIPQALGDISVVPANGSILCFDPPGQMPLSSN